MKRNELIDLKSKGKEVIHICTSDDSREELYEGMRCPRFTGDSDS